MSGPSRPAAAGDDGAQIAAIMARGPYSRAVWDFDGVIADSEPLQGRAYEIVLGRHGVQPEADFFRAYVGRNDVQIWTALRERYGLERDVDALRQERIEAYLERALAELRPNWFTRPLMEGLERAGSRQWVVSSGNKVVIDALLDAWELRPYVCEVFATAPDNAARYSKAGAMGGLVTSAPGPVILLEDNPGYLAQAASLGAITVAVRHELNALADGLGDFVLDGRAAR